jgi:nucleoside-diphosphate-sugar epimerase
MLNINEFIINHITHRAESLFAADLKRNHATLIREIQGKSVLVIGGAGTIGSSYIKALLRYGPAKLIVVDISENGLTELTRDLRSTHNLKVPDVYKTYPVNFGEPVFERILENEGPFQIVANFAAHKHVRSEKDEHSITALLENNVIKAERLLKLLSGAQGHEGTWALGRTEVASEVYKPSQPSQPPQHFFCVSTDKAANPVNIMGASKKIMEEVIMAYSTQFPITTARFANVAFSQGSLPDGFVHRMMKQQPLSAPSDVKRFFVSPEESGEICLLACILGKSGEIFFPKLDEETMMTFSDIAIAFLREQGYEAIVCSSEEEAKRMTDDRRLTTDGRKETDDGRPTMDGRQGVAVGHPSSVVGHPYPVYFFTSDTSGEKAYEEFWTAGEDVDLDSFSSLGVIKNAPKRSIEEIRQVIVLLEETLRKPGISKAEIVKVLSRLIPNFEHIETGKGLDQKM